MISKNILADRLALLYIDCSGHKEMDYMDFGELVYLEFGIE
jgi:hypothetical protein